MCFSTSKLILITIYKSMNFITMVNHPICSLILYIFIEHLLYASNCTTLSIYCLLKRRHLYFPGPYSSMRAKGNTHVNKQTNKQVSLLTTKRRGKEITIFSNSREVFYLYLFSLFKDVNLKEKTNFFLIILYPRIVLVSDKNEYLLFCAIQLTQNVH